VTAENYWKLQPESGWNAQNIVFTQGGRDALNKAYNAMIFRGHGNIGDLLVVSRVPWISYNWGPYSVGLNVLRAPGQASEGWRYTPDSIAECARFAKAHGRNIAGLVITSPDNPTGYTLPLSDQIELAHAALRNDYKYVIFRLDVSLGDPTAVTTTSMLFCKPSQRKTASV
jgi:aspartate/methionine/tyrosine aminotransferase